MRVLIVDDSVVFRSQIKAAIENISGISVAGTAANGKIALDRLSQLSVDVVILDLEMPEMSGLELLDAMRENGIKTSVIVFAAPSGSGMELALTALRHGASDFIAKPLSSGSLEKALEGITQELVPKILQFKNKNKMEEIPYNAPKAPVKSVQNDKFEENRFNFNSKPRAIGIGASTGGPPALETIFTKLKGHNLNTPIFIVQHMPPVFTEYLAKRLGEISGHPAKEAKHGELVRVGHIYVAPGDYHMSVKYLSEQNQNIICLDQNPKRNSVRPAVDVLFESLAIVYGSDCACLVLTGMGEDGLLGAKAIRNAKGGVLIQDQESSVVWGMPGAIHAARAYDAIANIHGCAESVVKMVK